MRRLLGQHQHRLLPAIAVAGAVVLVFTGLAMGVFNEASYRDQRAREVSAQASILAASVTAALVFEDRAAAQEYVTAMHANPGIAGAAVYDQAGGMVASYTFPGWPTPPRRPPRDGAVFSRLHVEAAAPVTQNGERIGTVFLSTWPETPARAISRHAGVALLVVMACLFVAGMGLAQATLRRANADLEDQARDLAEANRLLQVQMEEREKAEDALRQSQKMEAMGQLTGGVAHDFNNILMAASSGLDLLERTDDPARRQVLRDSIRQAVDRGASLTRQLLAIARRSTLQPSVLDLRAQVEGMLVLLERSLREDITVALDVAPGLWSVEADPSQLEVAVLNIAVNARDAMPDGGVITIGAHNMPGMADGELKGDYVRLSVRDHGVGMSRELLGRVFEPFFTTKGVGKGTGLGLSQVYGFIRASGGDVRVESEPGQGTTVSMYLPRSARQAPAAESGQAGEATPAAHGRVLMVEDDDNVAGMVSDMLEHIGYGVVRAVNASNALRLLERETVDVVFTDMVMPGRLSGLDLAREIAVRRPGLPVVLTTGYSQAVASARDQGLPLLVKPYRIDALARALEEARGGARVPISAHPREGGDPGSLS